MFFHEKNLGAGLYQGDILKYPGNFPFIDENGDILLIESNFDYWMIIGNTCDLDRELPSPHLSQITPLMPLNKNTPANIIKDLCAYQSYKKFFIPKWDDSSNQNFIVVGVTQLKYEVQSLQQVEFQRHKSPVEQNQLVISSTA